MDKLPEFNGEEDIEEWIEVFECRAVCSKVKDDKTKIQWCKSVIGSEGRHIINPQAPGEGEISLPHSWAIFSKLKNEDKDIFFF